MQSALGNFVGPKEVQPQNLAGRSAVVVGGARWIGYEISRALAHAGCQVIMVNRKEDQGSEAVSKVKSSDEGEPDIQWTGCDVGNLRQVKSVFSEICDSLDRLDFLVLSAGINAN